MLDKKILLKISYSGTLKYFSFEIDLCYKKLIEIVTERFEINRNDISGNLEICDSNGNILMETNFKSFLKEISKKTSNILYVRPIFCIKKFNNKLFIPKIDNNDHKSKNNIKLKNRASPVIRQNCFLGAFPVANMTYIKNQSQFKKYKTKSIITRRSKLIRV